MLHDDDGGMIAMDADHLGELLLGAGLEFRLVLGLGGIAAAVPVALGAAAGGAPEVVFRPEQNAQPVAGLHEGRVVRVVGAADEVEPGLLDRA